MTVLRADRSFSDELPVEVVRLPALRIDGQAARAHTQGLETVDGQYYVTARRDDVIPKRALLLRTEPTRTDWDVWDITPVNGAGGLTDLDHPGGMQSDGRRLWIPLANSRRKGRSIIRAFPIAAAIPGQPIKWDIEFPVIDHIGAVAVSADRKLIFGANWDTEAVYVWDFQGRLQRTMNADELAGRGLGFGSAPNGRAGLAVQDWKVIGDRLFASGLFRVPGAVPESPQSRLVVFTGFLEPKFERKPITLPTHHGIELAREAMALSDGWIHFLPEDLGASTRVFRISAAALVKTE